MTVGDTIEVLKTFEPDWELRIIYTMIGKDEELAMPIMEGAMVYPHRNIIGLKSV